MASGARSKFGAPMFEPEVFLKQMYCAEESTCDIVGTFRRPRNDSALPAEIRRPGNCGPFALPRYAPACNSFGPRANWLNDLLLCNKCFWSCLYIFLTYSIMTIAEIPQIPVTRAVDRNSGAEEKCASYKTYMSVRQAYEHNCKLFMSVQNATYQKWIHLFGPPIKTGDNHSVSLTIISLQYTLQLIAGLLSVTELFRRFINEIITITASDTSNERIRQALTSAFTHSGLELTFRQACTADQTGEVYSSTLIIEDDFGFLTKDFVKPTADGRQVVSGKSHHPNATFFSQSYSERQ